MGVNSLKPGGMVKNKESSESSIMKPLCWVFPLRSSDVTLPSKLEVVPGVRLCQQQSQHQSSM